MKKYLLFLLVLVILSCFGYFLISPKVEYLTNTTELYTFFTPYMKEWTDHQLQFLECEDGKYYYKDSAVCFTCDQTDACFEYAWVSRTGGDRMNPKGQAYLTNYKEFTLKMADFYSDGLPSFFECSKKDDKTFECKDGVSFVKVNGKFEILLKDEDKLEDVSRRICDYYEVKFLGCEKSVCNCEKRIIGFGYGRIETYEVNYE